MSKSLKIAGWLIFLAIIMSPLLIAFTGCEMPQGGYLQPNRPVLYAFTSASCGPCQADKPYLQAIEATGKVEIHVIDADLDPNTTNSMGVRRLPAYVVYISGREFWRGNSAAAIYQYLQQ